MGKKQILWIEDEIDLYGFLVDKLKAEGYDVIGVETGTEGLATMHRDKPDLVLLDLYLPDMDGWEVYRRTKADSKLSDIPVIVYTVRREMDPKMIGHIAGVDDFITKGISSGELIARIEIVLSRHKSGQSVFRPMLRCFLTGGSSCGRNVSDINREPYTVFLGYQFESGYYPSASLQSTIVKATQIVSGDLRERGLVLDLDPVGHREGEHITCEICEKMQRAIFCVFEVSDLNPNVMLELGTALGLGKKIALLRHGESKAPSSDMSGLKYIPYGSKQSLTNCSAGLAQEMERYLEEVGLISM